MPQELRRANRIKTALKEAGEKLDKEGEKEVVYFMGAIAPKTEKLYTNTRIDGENMCKMIDCFFSNPQDLRNLAIYVNMILKRRLAEHSQREIDQPGASTDPDIQVD